MHISDWSTDVCSAYLGFEEYVDLLEGRAPFDLMRRAGQLYVWERSRLSRSERIAQRLRDEQGIETQWLNDDEIRQLEPSLAPIYSRGLFFPDNGQLLNPHRLVQTLASSEEHTSELPSLMRIPSAFFCLNNKH